jgi:hypothetical protein
LSTGWIHPVDKKSLQIQKLEPILVAQIEWIRAEYALEAKNAGPAGVIGRISSLVGGASALSKKWGGGVLTGF